MDAKTQQSAPLLKQKETEHSKLARTIKKGVKMTLKQPNKMKQDSRTNKRNHYNFKQNMDKNPGSRRIKNSGDE